MNVQEFRLPIDHTELPYRIVSRSLLNPMIPSRSLLGRLTTRNFEVRSQPSFSFMSSNIDRVCLYCLRRRDTKESTLVFEKCFPAETMSLSDIDQWRKRYTHRMETTGASSVPLNCVPFHYGNFTGRKFFSLRAVPFLWKSRLPH